MQEGNKLSRVNADGYEVRVARCGRKWAVFKGIWKARKKDGMAQGAIAAIHHRLEARNTTETAATTST